MKRIFFLVLILYSYINCYSQTNEDSFNNVFAESFYKKAFVTNPNFAEAYCNRGLAKIKVKDKNSGCIDLNKAKVFGLELATKKLRKHCK